MKEYKAKNGNGVGISVGLVFLMFYIYLLMQFSKVFIYYDDYGYLSLSYGYNVLELTGSDYNLFQALEYIGHHYFDSNGRLLSMLLYLLLYMAGGLKLVQIFMATAVLGVAVLSYALVARQFHKHWRRGSMWKAAPVMTAAFICFLYGFIGILVHRLGTYWFAAAFLYIVPAITVIAFAWMYYETVYRKRSRSWWIGCGCLAFLAGFSQEQWMVGTIALIFGVWGYKYYVAKLEGSDRLSPLRRGDLAVLAAAIGGALPILTSPAARRRMEQNSAFAERSFVQKILYNIDAITRLFFAPSNQKYIYIFLFLLIIMTIVMIKRGYGKKIVHVLFLGASAAAGIYVFVQVRVFYHGQSSQYASWVVWMLFVYILWMSAQIMYYLFSTGNELQSLIYGAAFFSMACLTVVPELPDRVLLPFMLLSFSLAGCIFCDAFMRKGRFWVVGVAVLLGTGAVGGASMRTIYGGYSANWLVHQYNDAVIRQAVDRIHGGEKVTEVHLYQLLDNLCSNEMPYNPNFSFMIYWMDQYYDLPEDVELVYDVVRDMESLTLPFSEGIE